jgi:hypothetical protein
MANKPFIVKQGDVEWCRIEAPPAIIRQMAGKDWNPLRVILWCFRALLRNVPEAVAFAQSKNVDIWMKNEKLT